MQALYGYEITRSSLREVIKDKLWDKYALDPAIHDFTEKPSFEAHQKLVGEHFEKSLRNGQSLPHPDLEKTVHSEITIAISEYFGQLTADRKRIRNRMIEDANSIYDWYLKLLLLPSELAFTEKQDKEKIQRKEISGSDRRYPMDSSDLIVQLSTIPQLVEDVIANHVSWKGESEHLREWYKDIISKDEAYETLRNSDDHDGIAMQEWLLHFFKQHFFKNDLTLSFMTSNLLSWEDDAPILRNMLVKTLKSYEPDADPKFELRPLSINKDEDFEYFEQLFDETIDRSDSLEEIIQQKTKNWDLSRISSTDIILLKMALTEMIIFRSIPVKVTINEFIEISKLYSTPKSKQFINGILDVLANELTSDGIVKKSGRGLIDNK